MVSPSIWTVLRNASSPLSLPLAMSAGTAWRIRAVMVGRSTSPCPTWTRPCAAFRYHLPPAGPPMSNWKAAPSPAVRYGSAASRAPRRSNSSCGLGVGMAPGSAMDRGAGRQPGRPSTRLALPW